MSGILWPEPPTPPGQEHDATELVQPGSRAQERQRWELRALQWRAAEVAEAVFGGPVGARLLARGAHGLRGLLELEVPFQGLEPHRDAEARFLAASARDELLGATNWVVIFTPRVPAR